jgi:tRNA pseudouridine55 synthase
VSIDGFLVVNKPVGMTSHTVVSRVRRLTGQKKGGHTGTLDPFATGVLPVALGEATKTIQFLDESIKEYCAVMRLGQTTDTQDLTGTVLLERDWHQLTADDILHVIPAFAGNLRQLPPMFSAIKKDGVPLYRLARQGAEVERKTREIVIHSLVIDRFDLPNVTFTVSCSRGTYVRTLACDIGEALGCGAHLTELCRTRSGSFSLDRSVTLEQLESLCSEGALHSLLIDPQSVLSHLKAVELDDRDARMVRNGMAPVRDSGYFSPEWPSPGERVRLTRSGKLLAVAECPDSHEVKTLRLLRVFC